MKMISTAALLFVMTAAALAEQPYSEKADARQDIKAAEAQAAPAKPNQIPKVPPAIFRASANSPCFVE